MSIEAFSWALEQETGSGTRKLVLLILANGANERGKCSLGLDGIAEQANIHRRTVITCIKDLVAGGFITSVHRGNDQGGRASNLYTLNMGLSAKDAHRLSANSVGLSANSVGLSDGVAQEPKDNPKKNPKTIGRKTVPKTWKVTEAGIKFATEKGMSEEQLAEELQLFTDYEFKAARKDFDACWRSWCTNWKKFKREDNEKTKSSHTESFDAKRARLRKRAGLD